VNQLGSLIDALIAIGDAQNTVWKSMADLSDLLIVLKRLETHHRDGPTKLRGHAKRALDALNRLRGVFEEITDNQDNKYSIVGDPSPFNGPTTHSPAVNIRLLQQEKESLDPVWKKAAQMKNQNHTNDSLRDLAVLVLLNEFHVKRGIGLVEERYEMQRNATLNEFARLAQKPDFVVLRAFAGDEADAIFSPEESSDDGEWYFGPLLLKD
jgi:hypothetical protein